MSLHQSVKFWWLCGPIRACATRYLVSSLQQVFVLLLMLSGEIYLRWRPYFVVKIPSDIVTEHCCFVCVLFMKCCRCKCWLRAGKLTFISIHIIANRNSYQVDKSAQQCFTCVFGPPTYQKFAELPKYWQFLNHHPPGKIRYTAGEIIKIWCQELYI